MRLLQSLAPLLALLLAGCASNNSRQEYQAQLDALWTGKQLVVTQPIAIPGGQSGPEYMDGAQVAKTRRFHPLCRLEINPGSEPGSIPTGRYPVQSVEYRSRNRSPSSRENVINTFAINLRDDSGPAGAMTCYKESQGQLWRTPTPEQINTILDPTLRFE